MLHQLGETHQTAIKWRRWLNIDSPDSAHKTTTSGRRAANDLSEADVVLLALEQQRITQNIQFAPASTAVTRRAGHTAGVQLHSWNTAAQQSGVVPTGLPEPQQQLFA